MKSFPGTDSEGEDNPWSTDGTLGWRRMMRKFGGAEMSRARPATYRMGGGTPRRFISGQPRGSCHVSPHQLFIRQIMKNDMMMGDGVESGLERGRGMRRQGQPRHCMRAARMSTPWWMD